MIMTQCNNEENYAGGDDKQEQKEKKTNTKLNTQV